MGIFKKEVLELKWRFLSIVFFLFLTLVIVVYAKGFLFNMEEKPLPSFNNNIITRFINPEKLTLQIKLMKKSNDYYLWSQWYGKSFYQLLLLAIILYGFSSFAREIERKTIYFLIPALSRQTIFLSKILGGVLALVATVFIGGILPIFLKFPLALALKIISLTLSVSLFLYMIVIFFSIIKGEDVKTIIWSISSFVILSLPGIFKGFSYLSIYRYMKGVDVFLKNSFPFVPFVIMLFFSSLLFFINWKIFKYKDL